MTFSPVMHRRLHTRNNVLDHSGLDDPENVDDYCFSSDTEILAFNGFKKYDELKVGDLVLTYNLKDKNLEYQPIKKIWVSQYKGEMFHLKSGYIDLLISPNHRVPFKKQIDHGKTKTWTELTVRTIKELVSGKYGHRYLSEYEKAVTLFNEDNDLTIRAISKKVGVPEGTVYNWLKCGHKPLVPKHLKSTTIQRHFQFPIASPNFKSENITFSDDVIRVIAWIVTEGWSDNNFSVPHGYLFISQSNKNKEYVDEIDTLLKKLDFKTQKSTRTDGIITWRIKNPLKWLPQQLLENPHVIPKEILNASKHQLKILHETMMSGDGFKKGRKYYSRRKKLIDQFQEICLKIGYGSSIWQHKIDSIFVCTYTKKQFISAWVTKEPYNGIIWCVTTDNGTLIARRNGKLTITGNSTNDAEMQTETDPYPAGSPSLATDLTGEIARLRYQLTQVLGETYWFIDTDVSLATLEGRVPSNALLVDGSRVLTANWDAGSYEIRAQTFESDVATGTAPLVIASTTVVANLNADLWDGYQFVDYLDQAVKQASNVIFATVTVNNSGIHILDTNASHDLILAVGSDLTADRTLTLTTGDAARTITLSGDPTLNDWFDQAVKTTSAVTFATVDTGQGANELYDMDQNVLVASSVEFAQLTLTTTGKVIFRDAQISIASLDDGHLDFEADVSIDFNANITIGGDVIVDAPVYQAMIRLDSGTLNDGYPPSIQFFMEGVGYAEFRYSPSDDHLGILDYGVGEKIKFFVGSGNVEFAGSLSLGGDVLIYRTAANHGYTPDQFQAGDGLVTFSKAGTISDADFTTDTTGLIGIDTTNDRIYYRIGAADWSYVSASGGFSFPEQKCYVCKNRFVLNEEVSMIINKFDKDGAVHALPIHVGCRVAA